MKEERKERGRKGEERGEREEGKRGGRERESPCLGDILGIYAYIQSVFRCVEKDLHPRLEKHSMDV